MVCAPSCCGSQSSKIIIIITHIIILKSIISINKIATKKDGKSRLRNRWLAGAEEKTEESVLLGQWMYFNKPDQWA